MNLNPTRVIDKRNSLCQLPRSGWSVERAGLGATATYPAQASQRENKAVGLGLFTFEVSAYGKRMAKNKVLHQWHLTPYPSIDQTIKAVNVKRPRPSAQFNYTICKAGQLTSFATLPYQKTNRYAVVGEIAISLPTLFCSKGMVSQPELTYLLHHQPLRASNRNTGLSHSKLVINISINLHIYQLIKTPFNRENPFQIWLSA